MPRPRHDLEAARIRVPGVPSGARNIGGDSIPGSPLGLSVPSLGRSVPGFPRRRRPLKASPGADPGQQAPVPNQSSIRHWASRCPPVRPDEDGHVADPAVAKKPASYLDALLRSTTLEGQKRQSSAARYSNSSPGSPILLRRPDNWYLEFYIRTDQRGAFHVYPYLGGMFISLQAAENAISRHLRDLEDPKMSKESLAILSPMERAVRQSLYWPDGTMRDNSKPPAGAIDRTRLFVQALLDQHNDDHHLLGDFAYELKDVLHEQYFVCEGGDRYFHYNFSTKTKIADDLESSINIFFAEVKVVQGEHPERVTTCCCIVKPNDNGRCYGCKDNESVHTKHPNMADAYSGGHADGYVPLGGYHMVQNDYGEDLKAKEERLRRMHEGLDDPGFIQKIYSNCFATMEDEALWRAQWMEDRMSGAVPPGTSTLALSHD